MKALHQRGGSAGAGRGHRPTGLAQGDFTGTRRGGAPRRLPPRRRFRHRPHATTPATGPCLGPGFQRLRPRCFLVLFSVDPSVAKAAAYRPRSCRLRAAARPVGKSRAAAEHARPKVAWIDRGRTDAAAARGVRPSGAWSCFIRELGGQLAASCSHRGGLVAGGVTNERDIRSSASRESREKERRRRWGI